MEQISKNCRSCGARELNERLLDKKWIETQEKRNYKKSYGEDSP